MPKSFYTYVFRDPHGTPFYVGKGCGLRAWSRANRNARLLERMGAPYTVEIIPAETEGAAFQREVDLIAEFGLGNLLNCSNGGEGCHGRQTDEGRRAISAAMQGNARRRGKKFTTEALSRISAGVKKSLTPERLEQLRSAGLKGSRAAKELNGGCSV